jgi:hypothetical protein
MNHELERIWEEAAVAYLRYYPRIFLEGLREITNKLIQGSWCPDRDPN